MRSRTLLVIAGLVTSGMLVTVVHLADETSSSSPDDLSLLEVKGRAPKTGYSREQFGPAWADTDHNSCDTRNDILQRDLIDETLARNRCTVLTGRLQDPYSQKLINFVRGPRTSSLVQIDHVVSLSDAWQTGAQTWTPDRREQFANDPRNLLAVDGTLNQQKSDSDAASWLPPNTQYRCPYVQRQVDVKLTYGLWVKPAEKAAMQATLKNC